MCKISLTGPKGAHLNVSWTPKDVDREKSIQFYFDIVNRKIGFKNVLFFLQY